MAGKACYFLESMRLLGNKNFNISFPGDILVLVMVNGLIMLSLFASAYECLMSLDQHIPGLQNTRSL